MLVIRAPKESDDKSLRIKRAEQGSQALRSASEW